MKISRKWLRMAQLYRRFVDDKQADFSDHAALEMYLHESRGSPVSECNGYALGKKWMDVTVQMWREDIGRGLLRRSELDYPEWFLDRVLGKLDRGQGRPQEEFLRD